MKSREVSNPHVRFRDVALTYDEGEGPPPAKVTLLEDQSKTILSKNDSPDVGFTYSANPYRGCTNACSYCLDGETLILLGDSRTRRLADLRKGDEVMGTVLRGKYRYYERTVVSDHWTTLKLAYRITLSDGTTLVASGDHRFLTERGWKHVTPCVRPHQRPHLTPNNWLIGTGAYAAGPAETESYRRGYLSGMIRGDGMIRAGQYRRPDGTTYAQHQFRLALVDLEALARARRYLHQAQIETREYLFQAAKPGYREVRAITASSRPKLERILEIVAYPLDDDDDWHKGFLAGIFDAEGHHAEQVLRISNTDRRLIAGIAGSLQKFGFNTVIEDPRRGTNKPVYNVRVRGGLRERLRFFHLTAPAITRKWDLQGHAIKHKDLLQVVSIEPLGLRKLYDITTGTGDFIANGVVSHNCYARPTHEYLDMGAGTDFDTKIVVKRNAPELLREAFDKPSWKGELVMFSGVTDCYQAIERDLKLTRGMLEVCLEYKNPVSMISKSALVERDIDLFLALAKEARFHMHVSLAFSDDEMSRKIEPWAASPSRRFKVIERLAKAGVPVGVMLAPIIPGVNDSQMVTVLERAAAAGATSAGWVLLRLPHSVKQVFEERMRIVMPLAADKVLHRIRSTRGGEKLYDSRFGTRGRGEGPYADTIATMFETTTLRLGLNRRGEMDDDEDAGPTTFCRPAPRTGQLSLF